MSDHRRCRKTIREMAPPEAVTPDDCPESPDGRHCDHWTSGDTCGCCHCGAGSDDLENDAERQIQRARVA